MTNSFRRSGTLPSALGVNSGRGILYGSTALGFDPQVSNGTNYVPISSFDVSYKQQPNGEMATEAFYLANRAVQVVAVREIHSTAGTNGSAVTMQLTKETTTGAPGAGTALLTNNSDAGFNLKGTANTVQTGTLTATLASKKLAAGDRLSIKFTGTLTTLAGVVVTVTLRYI